MAHENGDDVALENETPPRPGRTERRSAPDSRKSGPPLPRGVRSPLRFALCQHQRAQNRDQNQNDVSSNGKTILAEQQRRQLARRNRCGVAPNRAAPRNRVPMRHSQLDKQEHEAQRQRRRIAPCGSQSVRSSSPAFSSMITKTNSTMIAPGIHDDLHGGDKFGAQQQIQPRQRRPSPRSATARYESDAAAESG